MKLSDIMGNSNLSIYTEIALVIVLVTFAAIVIHAFSKHNRATFEDARAIPLSDGDLATAGEESER